MCKLYTVLQMKLMFCCSCCIHNYRHCTNWKYCSKSWFQELECNRTCEFYYFTIIHYIIKKN